MSLNKKVLSTAVSQLGKAKAPSKPKDIIVDPAGQWKHPGQNTRIPLSGDSKKVTMEGVNYPVWAQPNVGPGMMMQPGQDYNFPEADYVDEFPQMEMGGEYEEMELDDAQIKELRDGGYVVEEYPDGGEHGNERRRLKEKFKNASPKRLALQWENKAEMDVSGGENISLSNNPGLFGKDRMVGAMDDDVFREIDPASDEYKGYYKELKGDLKHSMKQGKLDKLFREKQFTGNKEYKPSEEFLAQLKFQKDNPDSHGALDSDKLREIARKDLNLSTAFASSSVTRGDVRRASKLRTSPTEFVKEYLSGKQPLEYKDGGHVVEEYNDGGSLEKYQTVGQVDDPITRKINATNAFARTLVTEYDKNIDDMGLLNSSTKGMATKFPSVSLDKKGDLTKSYYVVPGVGRFPFQTDDEKTNPVEVTGYPEGYEGAKLFKINNKIVPFDADVAKAMNYRMSKTKKRKTGMGTMHGEYIPDWRDQQKLKQIKAWGEEDVQQVPLVKHQIKGETGRANYNRYKKNRDRYENYDESITDKSTFHPNVRRLVDPKYLEDYVSKAAKDQTQGVYGGSGDNAYVKKALMGNIPVVFDENGKPRILKDNYGGFGSKGKGVAGVEYFPVNWDDYLYEQGDGSELWGGLPTQFIQSVDASNKRLPFETELAKMSPDKRKKIVERMNTLDAEWPEKEGSSSGKGRRAELFNMASDRKIGQEIDNLIKLNKEKEKQYYGTIERSTAPEIKDNNVASKILDVLTNPFDYFQGGNDIWDNPLIDNKTGKEISWRKKKRIYEALGETAMINGREPSIVGETLNNWNPIRFGTAAAEEYIPEGNWGGLAVDALSFTPLGAYGKAGKYISQGLNTGRNYMGKAAGLASKVSPTKATKLSRTARKINKYKPITEFSDDIYAATHKKGINMINKQLSNIKDGVKTIGSGGKKIITSDGGSRLQGAGDVLKGAWKVGSGTGKGFALPAAIIGPDAFSGYSGLDYGDKGLIGLRKKLMSSQNLTWDETADVAGKLLNITAPGMKNAGFWAMRNAKDLTKTGFHAAEAARNPYDRTKNITNAFTHAAAALMPKAIQNRKEILTGDYTKNFINENISKPIADKLELSDEELIAEENKLERESKKTRKKLKNRISRLQFRIRDQDRLMDGPIKRNRSKKLTRSRRRLATGGEYIDMEITESQIREMERDGYIVKRL